MSGIDDDSKYLVIIEVYSVEEVTKIPDNFPKNALYLLYVAPGFLDEYMKAVVNDISRRLSEGRWSLKIPIILVYGGVKSESDRDYSISHGVPVTHPDKIAELKPVWIEQRKKIEAVRLRSLEVKEQSRQPEPISSSSDEDLRELINRAQDPHLY
jgi:hypothetical protein